MKKLLFAAFLALAPTAASAQCSGVFTSGNICGRASAEAAGTPHQILSSAVPAGALTVGVTPVNSGTNTAPLYNNAGILGNGAVLDLWTTFTQGGTGAVSVTNDQLKRGIIVTPEMFGDGVACSSASALGIQKAINYIASLSARGRIQLSPCTYSISTGLTISSNGIEIVGYAGAYSTGSQISFSPSASAQCAITIANGASLISNTTLHNFAITTSDTTTYKTAVCYADASKSKLQDFYVRSFTGGVTASITGAVNNGSGEIRLTVANASINWNDGWAVAVSGVVGTTEANNGWPIAVTGGTTIDLKGSTFTNAYVSGGTITASSTGIQTKGRELFEVEDVSISADLPLRISVNPNLSTNSLDQTHFTNMTFGQAIGTNCIVMADTATYMTSVKWLGTQSWGGGKDGFCWRDRTGAAISQQIRFDNVRWEQKATAGGTHFNIQPGATLYGLHLIDPMFTDRDGILARNVANLQIDNAEMTGTGKCLDVTSTVQNIHINGGIWAAGSTATLTGQTLVMSSGKNPSTGCLPPFVIYANSGVIASLGLSFSMSGSSSGLATFVTQAAAGTPTITIPTGTGTLATTASSPLVLSATTGALTCPTCATSSGGGAITGTAPIVVSAGGVVSINAPYSTISSPISGGIPFFNSTTTMASSALLAANALMIGGGAGATPATTATGTGVLTALAVNVGSAGAFVTFNGALGSPSSVGTMPAFTLGGTISGGGNQLNNIIIGTTTPLAAAFTTLTTTGNATIGNASGPTAIVVNGNNSGTNCGASNIVQIAGATNIGIGNVSKLITGGACDLNTALFGTTAIGVYIGVTTPSLTFSGSTASTSKTTGTLVVTGGIGNSGAHFTDTLNIITVANASTTAALCWNSGTGLVTENAAVGTCTVSDGRLKNVESQMTGTLDKLLQIKGVYFTWKDQMYGKGRQAGVIAQDVEKVFPELVSTDGEGKKSADYQRLTAPIIEALREMKATNDNLRQRMVVLENRKATK